MALLAATASLLVPTAAQAAQNVSSGYDVNCGIYPDNGGTTSDDPVGVTYDGGRNDAVASPRRHSITGSSEAVYPANAPYSGEDCQLNTRYRDRLTVGAGTSGLHDGDVVSVQVAVRMTADAWTAYYGGQDAEMRAEYSASASITSLDDCTWGQEVVRCDTPLDFSRSLKRHVSFTPPRTENDRGVVDWTGDRYYGFTTNAGTHESVFDGNDAGECPYLDYPCGGVPWEMLPHDTPALYTATAHLVVGHHYNVDSRVNFFTQAYSSPGSSGKAEVSQFTVGLTPSTGFAGVQLSYASAAAPVVSDTTAPQITADVTPAAVSGWHTSTPTVALSATDAGSGVRSITYSTTGAVTTPSTVVAGDHTSFPVGTDGVTVVTYQATDVAGNVSAPQTLTVRVDTTAPVLSGATDVTVPAVGLSGAPVTFAVTGQDNLGGPVTVSCDRPSGGTFPIGQTVVTCTGADQAGNTTLGHFSVTVSAPPPLVGLGWTIAAITMPPGIRNSVQSQYDAAVAGFQASNKGAGCGALKALSNHVSAQSGKGISAGDAAVLLRLIEQTRAAKGC